MNKKIFSNIIMEDKVDYFYTPEENREEFEIEAFK